jgi:DNA repair protein RecO
MRGRHHSHALVTPLACGEFVLSQRQDSLFRLQDGTITQPYLRVRDQSDRLNTACAIARALLQSQLPLRPAPALYQLTIAYLDQVAQMERDATDLLPSFYLKLMRYEGVLSLSSTCSSCDEGVGAPHLTLSGPYCSKCAPLEAIPFREEEWSLLKRLVELRNFAALSKEKIPPLFPQRVKNLLDYLS